MYNCTFIWFHPFIPVAYTEIVANFSESAPRAVSSLRNGKKMKEWMNRTHSRDIREIEKKIYVRIFGQCKSYPFQYLKHRHKNVGALIDAYEMQMKCQLDPFHIHISQHLSFRFRFLSILPVWCVRTFIHIHFLNSKT